MPYDALLRG
jgi:hypothetical protein